MSLWATHHFVVFQVVFVKGSKDTNRLHGTLRIEDVVDHSLELIGEIGVRHYFSRYCGCKLEYNKTNDIIRKTFEESSTSYAY